MEMYFYIISLVLSMFTLVSTIIMEFKEVVYNETNVFGVKEIVICLSVSVVLLAIGLATDKRYIEE